MGGDVDRRGGIPIYMAQKQSWRIIMANAVFMKISITRPLFRSGPERLNYFTIFPYFELVLIQLIFLFDN